MAPRFGRCPSVMVVSRDPRREDMHLQFLEWFERCVKICPVLHYSGDPPLGTVAAATDSELVLEGANPSTTSRRRPAPTHSLRTRVA